MIVPIGELQSNLTFAMRTLGMQDQGRVFDGQSRRYRSAEQRSIRPFAVRAIEESPGRRQRRAVGEPKDDDAGAALTGSDVSHKTRPFWSGLVV